MVFKMMPPGENSLIPQRYYAGIKTALGGLCIAIFIIAVILAAAYWNKAIGPYFQEHPLLWQKGLIILGVAALLLLGRVIYRYRQKVHFAALVALLPPQNTEREEPAHETRLPQIDVDPKDSVEGERIYIDDSGARKKLPSGWRRKYDTKYQCFFFYEIFTLEIRREAPKGTKTAAIGWSGEEVLHPWQVRKYPFNPRAHYFYNTNTRVYDWTIPVDPDNTVTELMDTLGFL